jgi:hypothetical protein
MSQRAPRTTTKQKKKEIILASENKFSSAASLSVLWTILRSIGVSFSLKVWLNSIVNLPVDFDLFFIRRLDYCFNFLACHRSI